jgi:2',3'-cyclic-nucleotide 2'-phosphodiesterase (5'-nucleotidase family)
MIFERSSPHFALTSMVLLLGFGPVLASGCVAFNAECAAPEDLVEPDRVVGYLGEPLGVRESQVRSRETDIGNLITDAYVAAYNDPLNPSYRDGVDPVDGAVENAGAIRDQGFCAPVEALPGAPEDPPPLRRAELREVLPFTNRILVAELNGAELIEILEHSVSALGGGPLRGHFLQVSGIAVTADCSRPAYARVTEARVGDEVVDPTDENRIFRIAVNEFLLREEGNDGFETLAGRQGYNSLGKYGFQVVEDYLLETSPGAPYVPPDGPARITLVDCD